ncbi:MAG: type I restriction-modification system subunit M [Magnetococcus sp. MYC-9]
MACNTAKGNNQNGATPGFEAGLFRAADKLRQNLEPSEYKDVVLGLVFLRHISDEHLAENLFRVPKEARWSHLQANSRLPGIGRLIDEAMTAIEARNASLKGVLTGEYSRPALNKVMLGGLIDLISGIAMGETGDRARDMLGRVYEYFLAGFAEAEGRRGGAFYTPQSVVRVLVEVLEPDKGRVYDPCCGSGGMLVQSERFVREHGGAVGAISIHGQESSDTTWRLARMNLAVRGMDADIRWNNEGSLHKDAFKDLRADFILANPPFHVSDWGGDRLREDARWQYGVPPAGNANFAWLQHILHHLAPNGMAGVVLANGSVSSTQAGEGEIRRAMVEADVVDCMVALPGQLFYSTQIPACLWFLARNKNPGKGWRDRRGEVLFIDARKLGRLADRTRREFDPEEIQKIAQTCRSWRGEPGAGPYADEAGFCKAVTLDEIRTHNHVLTPGRHVGAVTADEDDTPFVERFMQLQKSLETHFAEGERLETVIRMNLGRLVLPQ